MSFRKMLFVLALTSACLVAVMGMDNTNSQKELRGLHFEVKLPSAEARAQSDERARAAAEIESLREQIKVRESVLLAPTEEDRRAYAEFLAQPETGLIRLLPREKWEDKFSTRGGGAYYSFTRRAHEYGHGSDISLERDTLSVGFAGANVGFMLNLGDVPLETLSADAEAVRFMAAFRAPRPEPEARRAQMQFAAGGAQSGEWTYRSRLPLVAGNTYVLRSVNYETSDVLVAFRVVRRDSDGSAVLLWKLLKKYAKPTLQRDAAAVSGH